MCATAGVLSADTRTPKIVWALTAKSTPAEFFDGGSKKHVEICIRRHVGAHEAPRHRPTSDRTSCAWSVVRSPRTTEPPLATN